MSILHKCPKCGLTMEFAVPMPKMKCPSCRVLLEVVGAQEEPEEPAPAVQAPMVVEMDLASVRGEAIRQTEAVWQEKLQAAEEAYGRKLEELARQLEQSRAACTELELQQQALLQSKLEEEQEQKRIGVVRVLRACRCNAIRLLLALMLLLLNLHFVFAFGGKLAWIAVSLVTLECLWAICSLWCSRKERGQILQNLGQDKK